MGAQISVFAINPFLIIISSILAAFAAIKYVSNKSGKALIGISIAIQLIAMIICIVFAILVPVP